LLKPGTPWEDLLRRSVETGAIPEASDGGEAWIRERLGARRDPPLILEHELADGRTLQLIERTTSEGGTVGIRLDITERKRAEAEVKKLNEDLEKRVEERTAELRAAQGELVKKERLATLGQLTATVSHELRNPLAAMRASAHVIGVALNDNQTRARRAVQRIDRGIVRCDHIIDELLDYTRIRDLDPTATFLDEWLDEVIAEQETPDRVRVARERGLSGATAMIDPDRLRRAVINLFDNACQAMTENDDDTADHCLTVRTHRSDGWIEIEFHDDGPGIPPDVEAKIFEPLFSTKGFGVGLGLPVVKQIMEQHGGTVEVETEPGRGTRARLRLPRHKKSKQGTRTKAQ
jgi:signal transduction histidine kinase